MQPLTFAIMHKMLGYFGTDVRRINHALKVYGFAQSIAAGENVSGTTLAVLEAAALLHDIGIKIAEQKHNSTAGTYQELEGPPVARQLLSDLALPADFSERLYFLIGHHHTYSKIHGIDFQILVEADFLVNIYEDEMTEKQITAIGNNYFKTTTGRHQLTLQYPSVKLTV